MLRLHPDAHVVGIDESESMLAVGGDELTGLDLRVSRLEDSLPDGSFDLVVSALAVLHLDGPGKADLFARIAERLRPGGRFVLGDLVIPDDASDVVTPVDGVYDMPSTVADSSPGWPTPGSTHSWCGAGRTSRCWSPMLPDAAAAQTCERSWVYSP